MSLVTYHNKSVEFASFEQCLVLLAGGIGRGKSTTKNLTHAEKSSEELLETVVRGSVAKREDPNTNHTFPSMKGEARRPAR